MPKPFRRIVTANDANGRSEVQLDEPATKELATVLTEMWVTTAGPHNTRIASTMRRSREVSSHPRAGPFSDLFGCRQHLPLSE